MPISVDLLVHGRERLGQSLVAMSAPGHQLSCLFYVADCNSGLCFLVDTGVEANVIPAARTDCKHQQDGPGLQAVNGTLIATYGRRSLTLDLRLQRKFYWVFMIADIKAPILSSALISSAISVYWLIRGSIDYQMP